MEANEQRKQWDSMVAKLDSAGLTVDLIAWPEDHGPEGSFDTGNADEDAALVAKIEADSEWNQWAWCVVECRVSLGEVELASDWLGGCNYESEASFIEGGYATDMLSEATESALQTLASIAEDARNALALVAA